MKNAIQSLISGYNIDEDDKLILQVSRFDFPKRPENSHKAIRIYRKCKIIVSRVKGK